MSEPIKTLDALSLKLNAWEAETRQMQGRVVGKYAVLDDAFQCALDRLSDAVADVGFLLKNAKQDEAEAERARGKRLVAYQDMAAE